MAADPTGSSALLKMKKAPAEDKTFSIPISIIDNQGVGVTQKFEGEWFGKKKNGEKGALSPNHLTTYPDLPNCVCVSPQKQVFKRVSV